MQEFYFSFMNQKLAISEEDKKEIVNAAVGKNGQPLRNFTCSICQKTLYKPKLCGFGCPNGVYCSVCLDKNQIKDQPQTCPSCNCITVFKEFGSLLSSVMGELKVSCTKADCSAPGTTMTYHEFVTSHIDNCLNKKIECPICKKEQISITNMDSHYLKCDLVIT